MQSADNPSTEQLQARIRQLEEALDALGVEILNNRDRTPTGERRDWQAALDFIRARAALNPNPGTSDSDD